jgi:putative endonuclease
MQSKEIGTLGENIAKNYLEEKGYKILETNYKTKIGEIDIIAKKGKNLVFIEVKTITTKENFLPEDKVDKRKRAKLINLVKFYLQEKKINFDIPIQIDVIGIKLGKDKESEIQHFENVIEDKEF